MRMRREALELRQRLHRPAYRRIALSLDIGDAGAFEKVEHGSAGKGMGEATGWQDGVRSNRIVTRTERSIRPDENLASVLQAWQQSERLARLHLQMFRRILIDKGNRLIHSRSQHNAPRAPLALQTRTYKALARLRQRSDLLRQQCEHRLSDSPRRRDQQGRGIRPMLLLNQQIAGQQFGVRARVGQENRFAATGRQADIDSAIEQAFSRRNVAAAGSGNLMHTRNRLRAISQSRDSLHPAHAIDLMHPAQVRRDQRGGVHRAIRRGRRADNDPGDARDAGRRCQHIQHRRERALAARNVKPNRRDWRDLLARDHARRNLGEPLLMRHLPRVESAYIGDSPFQRLAYLWIEARMRLLNLRAAHAQPRRIKLHPVKLCGELQQRFIPALAHSSEQRAHILDQRVNLKLSPAQQAPALLRVKRGQFIEMNHTFVSYKNTVFRPVSSSYTSPLRLIWAISYSAWARGLTPASAQIRPIVVKPLTSPWTISAGSSEINRFRHSWSCSSVCGTAAS